MRGDAVFRVLVHVVRSDLHFERLAFGPDHGRMQRPVAVGFRLGDVVVEFPCEGRPEVVHQPQRCVTVLDALDEDTHRANVVERIDARVLAAHLVPDAVNVLRSAGEIGSNGMRFQLTAQHLDDALDVSFARHPAAGDFVGNLVVLFGFEVAE